MPAQVIDIWAEPYGGRIRVGGSGPTRDEPASVTILPAMRAERKKPVPKAPRRRTRRFDDEGARPRSSARATRKAPRRLRDESSVLP